MAPEIKVQSPDEQNQREHLQAEWANVGLSGGMFRPVNHADREIEREYGEPASDEPGRPGIDEDDWQPHLRCCL
ncbi:MAG: hypothetical protein GXY36_16070 [Chloroflexi bacterium]|nr:hypothetical protein [Chloroflexota bacterium]